MATNLEGSSEYLRMMRTYDKDLYKELAKNLQTQLKPILNPIESEINGTVTGELKSRRNAGMFNHSGRTQWGGVNVKAKTSIQPKNLIFIEGKGRGAGSLDGALGFEYAELAGIRRRPPRSMSKGWGSTSTGYHSYRQNGQGDAFISMLGKYGKPGRFLWKRVLKRKPEIEGKVESIAESLNVKINRRNS